LDVRIRKVRKGDIDRIIDIERSWHHLSHWSVDSYYRLINEDSFTSSFVAEIDNENGEPQIVGFVIFHVTAGISEIYNIAVAAEHQGKGNGLILLRSFLRGSKDRGAGFVWLEVRESNKKAIDFYKYNGFDKVQTRPNFYSNPRENAILMRLKLV